MSIVSLESLTKRYGGVVAVNDVSFEVHAGTIQGLLGPNGSGKTTLLNLVNGFTEPTEGRVLIEGVDATSSSASHRARSGIATVFQSAHIVQHWDVLENVEFGLYQDWDRRRAVRRRRALELLTHLGLDHLADEVAGSLPFGTQRMVEICRALAQKPKLLILDEPAAGMASSERDRLRELLRGFASGGSSVLLVEHDVAFVFEVSDNVVVLDAGRLLATGTPDEVARDQAVVDAYLGS